MSFFGPPPEMPDPMRFERPPWGPPLWDRPSEDTLGISADLTTLLAVTDEVALVFDDVKAYPNGFLFGLGVLRNPNLPPEEHDHRRPMMFHMGVRVGFSFADGTSVSSEQSAFPGMPPRAVVGPATSVVIASTMPGGGGVEPAPPPGFDADGVPTGHVLIPRGGGGSGQGFSHGFWCFRLPSAGPMTIHADMPGKLDEVSVEVDATPIVEAGARSRILWPRT